MSDKKNCLRCFGKGRYEGVYGRTVCGDCDGTGEVSAEKRKEQLKKYRELLKKNKAMSRYKDKITYVSLSYI